MRWVVLSVAGLAGIAWLGWQAVRIIPIGTAYAAKTLCSEYFVAGRRNLEALRSDLRDIEPMFGQITYYLDPQAPSVTAWIGPGVAETRAVFRAGLGCSLERGTTFNDFQAPGDADSPAAGRWTWPEAPEPALSPVLDEAFSEPSSTSHRRTRAVVVVHRGRIVAERYAPGFGPQRPLIGWSMTKSITNTLIGMRVGDGALRLDEPAPVPEWRAADDPRRHITLGQLLQMSSGLDFEEIYDPGSDATRMLFLEPDAAAFAAGAPLAHEPGSHWSYSSGTSNILARIFRESAGPESAAAWAFIHERLVEPLGIRSLVLEPDATGTPVGSSFSYATARDWARLGQFWLQDGVWNGNRLLPEGWMAWSTAPAPAAPRGEYGAQFWLNAGIDGEHRSFPDLPASMYMAHGFNSQVVAVLPEQELVVVRLGFTTDGSWDDNAFIAAILEALGFQPAGNLAHEP